MSNRPSPLQRAAETVLGTLLFILVAHLLVAAITQLWRWIAG